MSSCIANAAIQSSGISSLCSLIPAHEPSFEGNEWRYVEKAEGYRYTLVNGEVTFVDGVCTGAIPGKLLRHGKAAEVTKAA